MGITNRVERSVGYLKSLEIEEAKMGQGNFGHAGRPGHVGGSAGGGRARGPANTDRPMHNAGGRDTPQKRRLGERYGIKPAGSNNLTREIPSIASLEAVRTGMRAGFGGGSKFSLEQATHLALAQDRTNEFHKGLTSFLGKPVRRWKQSAEEEIAYPAKGGIISVVGWHGTGKWGPGRTIHAVLFAPTGYGKVITIAERKSESVDNPSNYTKYKTFLSQATKGIKKYKS